MPGGKFARPVSPENRALAAQAAAGHIPAAAAAPSPAELLAQLKSGGGAGGIDPQVLMAILSMLAGMGPQGVPGAAGAPVPGAEAAAGAGPIEAAYGAY